MSSQRENKLVRTSLLDVPNNSNKATRAKENTPAGREKLKPVVSKGGTTKKKRTVMDKFKESFLGESENLGDYVLYDVLVPAFRDTISDMGFGVIERLFGNGRSYRGHSNLTRDRGRSHVSYVNNRRDSGRDLDRSSRARHDFDHVLFKNKYEAEEVLSTMVHLIDEYNCVSVREFYELSNIEPEYTDDQYGWENLRGAYVERTRAGYVISFPPTRSL